jgi:hypothetical protein
MPASTMNRLLLFSLRVCRFLSTHINRDFPGTRAEIDKNIHKMFSLFNNKFYLDCVCRRLFMFLCHLIRTMKEFAMEIMGDDKKG